jgi:hypothetical protein
MSLVWNRYEKSYCGHEWLQYIVKRILVPRGYKPSGIINWFTQGEYWPKYHTIVEGNSVRKYRDTKKIKKSLIGKLGMKNRCRVGKLLSKLVKKLIRDKVNFYMKDMIIAIKRLFYR